MLRKFAAALIASALIAGPALAQSTPPAAPGTATSQGSAATPAKPAVKTTKTVKHVSNKHMANKHVANKHVANKHMAKRTGKHIARIKHTTRHASHAKAGQTRHAGTGKSGKQS